MQSTAHSKSADGNRLTGLDDELSDLEVAQQLVQTCYELYRRVPTGLAPEIVVFNPPGVPWLKEHSADIGGGDFYVKQQVSKHHGAGLLLKPRKWTS